MPKVLIGVASDYLRRRSRELAQNRRELHSCFPRTERIMRRNCLILNDRLPTVRHGQMGRKLTECFGISRMSVCRGCWNLGLT